MTDKFKLFKTNRFKIALKYGYNFNNVIEKTEPFEYVLDCGCVDKYDSGYYVLVPLFGYFKLEDLWI